VPITDYFVVSPRALGLWSRRNRHCGFSGYKRLTVNFVRRSEIFTVSGVTAGGVNSDTFLDATILDAATPMFPLDFVNPHLERLLMSWEWPKTIYPSDPPRALSRSSKGRDKTWEKGKSPSSISDI